MNFGRAALLGLSAGGECDSAYPRCPRNEDEMLFYLNNHRGGFFRFFNGGNTFGDDNNNNYLQQQHQQQQQIPGASGANQGLNLLALQALADTLNQGNGLNLGNLFSSPSNHRPTVQNYAGLQADQSQGGGGFFSMFKPVSDVVSNLLTGVVGNRFSRRLSKRSLSDESIADEGRHRIEKRIVNLKDFPVEQNFFETSSSDEKQNTLHNLESSFTFSNDNRIRSGETVLALKFPNEVEKQEIPLSQINQGNFISPSDVARRLKILFPEASGHLRFDNDQFNRELLKALVNDRIGKILTGVQQVQQSRPINSNYDNINRYQGYQNDNNQQKYLTQSQNYYAGGGSTNINTNHYNKGDRSHIVYITNAQGQIEYTLNELTGEKQRY